MPPPKNGCVTPPRVLSLLSLLLVVVMTSTMMMATAFSPAAPAVTTRALLTGRRSQCKIIASLFAAKMPPAKDSKPKKKTMKPSSTTATKKKKKTPPTAMAKPKQQQKNNFKDTRPFWQKLLDGFSSAAPTKQQASKQQQQTPPPPQHWENDTLQQWQEAVDDQVLLVKDNNNGTQTTGRRRVPPAFPQHWARLQYTAQLQQPQNAAATTGTNLPQNWARLRAYTQETYDTDATVLPQQWRRDLNYVRLQQPQPQSNDVDESRRLVLPRQWALVRVEANAMTTGTALSSPTTSTQENAEALVGDGDHALLDALGQWMDHDDDDDTDDNVVVDDMEETATTDPSLAVRRLPRQWDMVQSYAQQPPKEVEAANDDERVEPLSSHHIPRHWAKLCEYYMETATEDTRRYEALESEAAAVVADKEANKEEEATLKPPSEEPQQQPSPPHSERGGLQTPFQRTQWYETPKSQMVVHREEQELGGGAMEALARARGASSLSSSSLSRGTPKQRPNDETAAVEPTRAAKESSINADRVTNQEGTMKQKNAQTLSSSMTDPVAAVALARGQQQHNHQPVVDNVDKAGHEQPQQPYEEEHGAAGAFEAALLRGRHNTLTAHVQLSSHASLLAPAEEAAEAAEEEEEKEDHTESTSPQPAQPPVIHHIQRRKLVSNVKGESQEVAGDHRRVTPPPPTPHSSSSTPLNKIRRRYLGEMDY